MILIIEDEDPIRENMVEVFELAGYEVCAAATPDEGLRLLRELLPEAVVCDIMFTDDLNGMDGYSVLSGVRDDPMTVDIPFIFITALAKPSDVRLGMGRGADDYVTKPFHANDLVRAVHVRLERRRQMREKIEQQIELLRQTITRALPHEMNTALQGILGCALRLHAPAGDAHSANTESLIDILIRSANRLQELFSRYVLYARLEALTPEELAELRQQADFQSSSSVRQAAIATAERFERVGDLSVEVVPDGVGIADTSLKRITAELVSNAFKFSAPKTPVHVRARVEGNRWYLRVSDRGKGMQPEEIAKVGAFIQFGRRMTEFQGTGLGLALVMRLAELAGGKVRVDSHPDDGTTVTVALPLARTDGR